MNRHRPSRLAIAAALALLAVAAAAPAATVTANKGLFSQGQWRGGITGGYVSTSGDDYLMLGLGVGYNIADGLTGGLDYETWLIGSPTVHKLAPWVGYTFWQVQRIKPYVAGFWRQNWVSGFDDYQDIGARLGVFLPRGRSYLGVGVVYEYRLDAEGVYERDNWYPEIRFAVGF
jgi:hypothetical protein